MMTKTLSLVVSACVFLAIVQACDLAALFSLANTNESIQCALDSGFNLTSPEVANTSSISILCYSSSACQSMMYDVASLDIANCATELSDTVDAYNNECGNGTGGTDSKLIIYAASGGGALLIVIVIVAFCICKKRRAKRVKLGDQDQLGSLEEAMGKRSSSYTHPRRHDTQSTGGTTDSSDPGSVKLWEDPVVVAARIRFRSVKLSDCISRGGYGEVYRGIYHDRTVAVKMLLPATRKDMKHIVSFLSEIKLAATLEHPSIVLFIGVAWESLSDLYSVAEFMDGGDLRTLLTNYSEDGTPQGMGPTELRIAMQVADALTYLHSLQPMVLHRDLKSRNILLTTQLDAKITDFGASKARLDRTLTAGVGTSLWMAPEVVLGEKYDEKADVYSFGVVLSELDTHEPPYEQARQREDGEGPLPEPAVLQMVLMGRLHLDFSPSLTADIRALAERCVNLDPKQRPTAAQAAYELRTAIKSIG